MYGTRDGIPYLILIVPMCWAACTPAIVEPLRVQELAQSTPSTTVTPESTAASSAEEPATIQAILTPPSEPCLELVEIDRADYGRLRVVYSTHCVSDLDFTPTRLWLWDEETRSAVPFPLPDDAIGPRLSADQSMIVFRRDVDETDKEIWVMNSNGQNERRLVILPLNKIRKRFPGANAIDMQYGWVQETHTVFYQTRPLFELDQAPFDTIVLTDAETGESRAIVPPGEVYTRAFSPDGNQLAALGLSEVRLIDTGNAQLQSVIPLSSSYVENPLNFSPDGKLLTVLTPSGVAIIDTTNGRRREVVVDYILWGAGDSFLYMAALQWRDNETFVMIAAPPIEVPVEGLDLFAELLDWEFVVYQVDATRGAIRALQTLRGSYPSAALSPNLDCLAFVRFVPDSNTQEKYLAELYLADLATGELTLYTAGNQVSYFKWGPDSRRFVYALMIEGQWKAYLGEVDREPIPFDVSPYSIMWVDAERFLAQRSYANLELHLFSIYGEDILIESIQPNE